MMAWSSLNKFHCYLVFTLVILILAPAVAPGQKKHTQKERVYLNEKGELESQTILKKRAQFQYDDGGLIRCNSVMRGLIINGKPYRCNESAIRDFIWSHLNEKKLGYIRIAYQGVDAGSQEHIFIEPYNDEVWRATWWTVRYSWNHPTKISLVGKLAPERVDGRETGEWKLQFKNDAGEVLAKMPGVFDEY